MNSFTQEQIDGFKKEFGKLYKVTVCGVEYIIRPLYKPDWDLVTKLASDNPAIGLPELDDKIVDLALIGPKPDISKGGWAVVEAGVIPTLSKWISAKSGFIVPELAGQQDISSESLGKATESVRPTDEEIEAVKSQCTLNTKLVNIDGDYFIIRPILRNEWRSIMKSSSEDSGEREHLIAQRATIWPKKVNWDETPAGYCFTIADAVMSISGYSGAVSVEEL